MTTSDKLIELITEACGQDDSIEAAVQVGESAWGLVFEDLDVEIDLSAAGFSVTFSVVVGTAPKEQREPLLAFLLHYSGMWRQTGGMRAALIGEDEEIVLMIDVAVAELTPALIATIAVNLAARARDLHKVLAANAADARPTTPTESADQYIRI